MSSSSAKPLWWCKICNVPLLSEKCENCNREGERICSDLKPVFEDECKFLERETASNMPGTSWQDGMWMRYKTIWFRGQRLMRLSGNGRPEVVRDYPPSKIHRPSNGHITAETLYSANRSTLEHLEKEAISFVDDVVKSHPDRKPVVSFSGGKDSLAVSYIVRKALGSDGVEHMFSNTTMEYPDTLRYIKDFKATNPGVTCHQSSSHQEFLELCKVIGPPSRINAWCCSVFKSAPIANMVRRIRSEGGIISFEGIRKKESVRRRNRERTYLNKKIALQLSAYPILEWREIEVWLFILTKHLSFNKAYEKGFNRVGCMYCPNNTPYNEYLVRTYYPEPAQQWLSYLLDYAKESNKADPSDYITSGAWKMRVGENLGKSAAYVRKTPCLKNVNAMHFMLDRQIDDCFIDRFKPFGNISQFQDNMGEGFVVKEAATDEPLFMIKRVSDIELLRAESRVDPSWDLGNEFLCVDLLTSRNCTQLLRDIERQIRKFQACVLCGACAGTCPAGAVHINPHFHIDEKKCTHCFRCTRTRFLRDSCVALHAGQQTRRYRDGDRI